MVNPLNKAVIVGAQNISSVLGAANISGSLATPTPGYGYLCNYDCWLSGVYIQNCSDNCNFDLMPLLSVSNSLTMSPGNLFQLILTITQTIPTIYFTNTIYTYTTRQEIIIQQSELQCTITNLDNPYFYLDFETTLNVSCPGFSPGQLSYEWNVF